MKTNQILLFTLVILIFTGCATTYLSEIILSGDEEIKKEKQAPVSKNYYKEIINNLDYKFYHKIINQVSLPVNITSKIHLSDKIVICSADRIHKSFDDLQFIIENWLKTQCLNKNFIVLERDVIPLKRIYSENSRSFKSLSQKSDLTSLYTTFRPAFGLFKPFLDSSTTSKINLKPILSSFEQGDDGTLIDNNANISFADKLLAFRILDAGIKKATITSNDSIIRVVGIIAELSLIEVSTSRILACEIIEHFDSDIISNNINSSAYVFRMENTSYPFPLLRGFSQKGDISITPGKIIDVSSGKDAVIKFRFKLGWYTSMGEILDINENIVHKFSIPENIHEWYYTYTWNLLDYNGQQIKPGKYYITVRSNSGKLLSKRPFTLL